MLVTQTTLYRVVPNTPVTLEVVIGDAQVTVARQAAEQIADYLLNGVKKHAVNGDKVA